MNSIFSSFDAVSAELMSQKVRVFFAPTTSNNINNLQSQDHSSKVTSTAPCNMNQNKKQESSKPRFAPEFDGLNCFETLVSY